MPLEKVREISRAKRGVLIRNGHRICAAIDEPNILIRVFGLHGNQELGEEAEIGLKVESFHGSYLGLGRKAFGACRRCRRRVRTRTQ